MILPVGGRAPCSVTVGLILDRWRRNMLYGNGNVPYIEGRYRYIVGQAVEGFKILPSSHSSATCVLCGKSLCCVYLLLVVCYILL